MRKEVKFITQLSVDEHAITVSLLERERNDRTFYDS